MLSVTVFFKTVCLWVRTLEAITRGGADWACGVGVLVYVAIIYT